MSSEKPSDVGYKGMYFLYFGAQGAFFPLMTLFLQRRGLPAWQIGWLLALLPLCKVLLSPGFGYIADRTGYRRGMVSLFAVSSSLSILLLWPRAGFALLFAGMFCVALSTASMVALMDALTCEHLGDNTGEYGKIRRWGSVAFLMMAPFAGWSFANWSELAFVWLPAMMFMGCALMTRFAVAASPVAEDPSKRTSWSSVKRFLRPFSTKVVLFGMCLHYMGQSTFDAFFGLRMVELGFSETFVGLAWSIGVFVEVLVMGAFHRLLRRFSPLTLLVVAGLGGALRWQLIASLDQLWPLIAAQMLHAVSFGVFYLSCTTWLQTSGKALRSTAQSLGLASMSVGVLIGFQIGGLIVSATSIVTVFKVASAVSLVAMGVFMIARRLETELPVWGWRSDSLN